MNKIVSTHQGVSTSRSKMIVAAHLFVFNKKSQVLLLKRANTSYRDGWWSVPAGHVEHNESPMRALIREAHEEVGLRLDVGNCVLAAVMYRRKAQESQDRIDFFFKATADGQHPKNCEPDKCSELEWYSMGDLPEQLIPYVKSALLSTAGTQSCQYLEFFED